MKKFLVSVLLGLVVAGGYAYWNISKPVFTDEQEKIIYIHTGWNYDSLLNELTESGLRDAQMFDFIARKMNLHSHIYPGKYTVEAKIGMLDMIRHFRSASQDQVTVQIRGEMSEQQVLEAIASPLELTTEQLIAAFDTFAGIKQLGLDGDNDLCVFIADSYFFLWSVPAPKVLARFKQEYEKFWNTERKVKANEQELTEAEVAILASIVDAEAIHNDELERIAGVYLNRLRKNWPLQADPTIRFALRDSSRRRLLHEDLEIDHPYNTYKKTGLPPGPVQLPSPRAIDAVLNAENHDFMFFVARPDFSGYHDFATSYSEHLRLAARYHRALDQQRIRR